MFYEWCLLMGEFSLCGRWVEDFHTLISSAATLPWGLRVMTKVQSSPGQNGHSGKQPRQKLVGVDSEHVTRKNDQYRATMLGFVKVLADLKNNGLNKEHVKLMRKTPFWALFDSYYSGLVPEKFYKKSDSNIQKIVECFDSSTGMFKFGDSYYAFTPEHIGEILGLPSKGELIDISTRYTPTENFVPKYFDLRKQLVKKHVNIALVAALRGSTEEDVKDVVRLICMYFCMALLFANTGGSMAWFPVKCIGDLDKMSGYNWAQAVYDWLVKSILKKKSSPATVTGCTSVLLFWFCEITGAIPQISGRGDWSPRFLRWDLQQLKDYLQYTDLHNMKVTNSVSSVKKEQTTPNADFSIPSYLYPKKRKRSTTAITPTLAKCSTRQTRTKGRSSRVRKVIPAREICTEENSDDDTEATFVLNENGGQDDITTDTDGDSSEMNTIDTRDEYDTASRTPPFRFEYVEELEYSVDDMTNKYKRSCKLVKEKDLEIDEERKKRASLERQLDISNMRYRRVTFDMDIECEKTSKLEEEVADLKQVRSALEKECEKRAHEETVLRLYAAEKEEEIDKMHEEKMDHVGLKERYEECTKRVLELETELQDTKIRLEISGDQADLILHEKEERISALQAANGKLVTELEEAKRTIKCLENASKESSEQIEELLNLRIMNDELQQKLENFRLKETPEMDIISTPSKVNHAKDRHLQFLETADSGVFFWQENNFAISRIDNGSLVTNNQISSNELEYAAPLPPHSSSEGLPLEISSFSETKPIVDQLLRLKPPPKRNPSDQLPPDLLLQSMELVPRVKSFLVSQLTSTNTTDLNTMIDLANNAFSTLDWCRTDYRSFHGDVRDFIRCRSERLAAEEERNGCVYTQILSRYKELVNRSKGAEEALLNAECGLTSAVEKLEAVNNEIAEVRELLRGLEKDMADREVEIEALKDERDRRTEAFSSIENEAQRMCSRWRDIDRRLAVAMEGDERTSDRLRYHIC